MLVQPVNTCPAVTAVPFQFFVLSATAHHLHLRDLRHRPSCELHTLFLQKQRLRAVLSSHGPCFSPLETKPTSLPPPAPQQHVSATQVGPQSSLSTAAPKGGAGATLAGTHLVNSADARAGRGPFPKPPAHGYLHNAYNDLMHHQYRLSVLQWNPGPARKNPAKIVAATCGRFHTAILQEANDHVPHVSDQFIAYTGDTDLAILLNRDTFEPNAAVFAFHEASTSKDTWGMEVLVVRLGRRPSLSGSSTVTCCSVPIHNVVAKKRDASADLLHTWLSTMSTSSVATSTMPFPESLRLLTTRPCGVLGALEDSNRERTEILIMPMRSI